MARKTLTYSQKKDIYESVARREDQLPERLSEISDGRAPPHNWNKRLNEPKIYRCAAVFIDIDDFTEYILSNGPEKTLYMLGLFMPEAMRVITEYNGYFEKNTGDGLLAYFGTDKDPSEAVSDVLQYVTTVQWILSKAINPKLENMGIEPVSISSGATFGEVYIAEIGTKSQTQELKSLTAVSSQINIAYQIENFASKDQHLVGPKMKYYADDEDTNYLELHNVLDEYEWKDPETLESNPYMIYKYTGRWEDDKEAFEEVIEQ